MIPFLDRIHQFLVTSNKVGAIVGPDLFRRSPSCDKPSQGVDEGLRVKTVSNLKVDRSNRQAGEQYSVSLDQGSAASYVDWAKLIDPSKGEWWFGWSDSILR